MIVTGDPVAFESVPEKRQLAWCQSKGTSHSSIGALFIFLTSFYSIIAFLIIIFPGTLLQNLIWEDDDTKIFYLMNDVMLSGRTPYVNFHDVRPSLTYIALAVPALPYLSSFDPEMTSTATRGN